MVTGVHIISEGTVCRASIRGKGEPLELYEAEVFGEKGLMESYASSHTYYAKAYSEILFLPGATFRHICQLYLTVDEIERLISALTEQSEQQTAARRSATNKPAFIKVTRASIFGTKTALVRANKPESPTSGRKTSVLGSLFKSCMMPNSTFRMWWGAVIFSGLIFYSFSGGLLLQATLRQNFVMHFTPLLVVCYFVDFLFILDTLLRAFCFAFDDNGVIVTDYRRIFEEYALQSSSLLNLFLVMPFDLIFGVFINYRLIPILRLLKIVHLVRFDDSFNNIEDLLFTYAKITISFELSRFIYLYMILFFVCHWCGCLWTLVAEVSMKTFGYDVSWRYVDTHTGFFRLNYQSLSGTMSYWREMYWTVNVMSSIGWPSVLPTNLVEYIAISPLMFVGYLLFSALVGALSSLMGSFNSTGHAFNAKVEKIKQLVKYKSVSKPIERKITR